MKPIPEDARATMAAYREGRSLKRFLQDMWDRRAVEHPARQRTKWNWPVSQWSAWRASLKAKAQTGNVTAIGRKVRH